MATAKEPSGGKPKRDLKVLSLGLPRTGSASLCEALTILGYKDVYHGLKAIGTNEDWVILNRAADASFPVLPTYTSKPFTRDEWDEVFGHCEGVTDIGAMFAPQLIEAYPDAKVILVARDYDKWFKSINEGVLSTIWSAPAEFSVSYLEPMLGSFAGVASRKMILGLFQARNADECRANAREAYDRHHRVIREIVPPERLLEYRMGEGWERLCEFLGKPVPDAEFPWVNEAAALQKTIRDGIIGNLLAVVKMLGPWVFGATLVGAGAWSLAKSR
ncbi:P-loop containing nucleoside triphosphate hydrolase protein [Mariannaea sp. PMI_226]|nr:P-loop containing nucleoside triphosphate hydrolase protein [Mariannaea sp. PMI_226]